MRRYKKQISRIVTIAMLFAFLVGNSNMVHAMEKTQVGYASKYITVKGNDMHLALYGKLDASGETFADEGKTTLVMMPALGVPSPHIYFKPLAQSLDESFNIVIVEPFGYGLSDVAATDRTVDNINSELNAALDTMGIKQCVLLVHSISGVYGLNFVQNYPEKVKGFIAVDNTVYDEELAEAMEMEKKYMLQGIDEFQKIKNSFSSLEEFQTALKTDPDKYGAALPQVSGYTYTESDGEEYIQAYSLSSNDTIRNEVNGMDQSLLSIKNKKFPSALPVLTMISSENVQNVPAWETAHRNQLDLESGNHQLYIRSIDIPYIEWSCIHGRNVVLPEGKTGNIYRKVNGNYPQISRCSLRIIHLLYRKQKMIFTKSKEYYIHRIRRFWGTGEFSFHSFRYYRRKLEMGITIGIQVPKVIPV